MSPRRSIRRLLGLIAAVSAALAPAPWSHAAPVGAPELEQRLATTGWVLIEIDEKNDEPAKMPPVDFTKTYVNYYSYARKNGALALHRCQEHIPGRSSRLAVRYQLLQGRIAPPDRFQFIDRLPALIDPVLFAPSVRSAYTPYRQVLPLKVDLVGQDVVVQYGDEQRSVGPGQATEFWRTRDLDGRTARTEVTVVNRGTFQFQTARLSADGENTDCIYEELP